MPLLSKDISCAQALVPVSLHQPSHTDIPMDAACGTAPHTQQASQGEKHFSSLLPVSIFLLRYTHLQAQRGEECLALLR